MTLFNTRALNAKTRLERSCSSRWGGSGVALLMGLVPAMVWSAGTIAPPVVVAAAERRSVIEEVPLSGTVSSPRVARLSPEVAGLVAEILVEARDRVESGAPLVRLDRTLASLALEAATAATEQAREELADARRRLADAQESDSFRGVIGSSDYNLRKEKWFVAR